jgi:hypothetical protein
LEADSVFVAPGGKSAELLEVGEEECNSLLMMAAEIADSVGRHWTLVCPEDPV